MGSKRAGTVGLILQWHTISLYLYLPPPFEIRCDGTDGESVERIRWNIIRKAIGVRWREREREADSSSDIVACATSYYLPSRLWGGETEYYNMVYYNIVSK